MYYQRQILPLGSEGHFLLAVHFPRHKIGGECTRESGHAYFAYGHIDCPGSLTDVTQLFCPPRKASRREARHCRSMARTQHELAESESSWLGKHYAENARQFNYQAMLAEREAVFVPRTVRGSQAGLVAAGIEREEEPVGGDGVLRFVDPLAGQVLAEHREKKWPDAQCLCYPKALSPDAGKLVSSGLGPRSERGVVFGEYSVPGLRCIAPIQQPTPVAEFCWGGDGWVAVDQEIHIIAPSTGETLRRFNLPRGVLGWTVQGAQKGHLIALAGDKGQISLVHTGTGETKTYFPHRGCKRDELADVALSADGEWMASRIQSKKSLMVTRLADGRSWFIMELIDECIEAHVEEGFRTHNHIPAAFGFVGARLLVSDALGKVVEIDLSAPAVEHTFISEQGAPGARAPLRISPKTGFEQLVKKARLERIRPQLIKQYSPAVKLRTNTPKKSGWSMPDKHGAPELGASRFGGWPDLPDGEPWPMWQGRPMSFLAQISLSEIHARQGGIRLPEEGVLLFFLGCTGDVYENEAVDRDNYMVDILVGAEAADNRAWKVIYAAPGVELERTRYEASPAPQMYAPCMVTVSRGGLALPDEDTAAYEAIGFEPDERDNYNEMIDILADDDWRHQLMGFPNLIQGNPPEIKCVLAAAGKDPYRAPEPDSDGYHALLREASEWGLLLQLTSDDRPGFLWGDAGHFYFYGKRTEMESGDFSNVWVSFEN